MRRSWAAVAVMVLWPMPASLAAQALVPARGITVTVLGGAAAFGNFHEQPLPAPAPAPGEPPDPALERVVSASPTATAGLAATFWLTPSWGARAHVSTAETRFIDRVQSPPTAPAEPTTPVRAEFGAIGVRLYDASAVFRLPGRFGELSPYGLAGAGFVDYRIRGEPPPGVIVGARERRFAGVLGIGASYHLGRWAVAAEVTNHLAGSPVADRLPPDPPPGPLDQQRTGIVNQFRLTAGGSYTIPLRRRPPGVVP